MELCCHTRALPSLPRPRASLPSLSSSKTLSSLSNTCRAWHFPRASASDETSTILSQKFEEPPAPKKAEETPAEAFSVEESPDGGEQSEFRDFFNKLDVKLDFDDNYSVVLYGAGALLALWISAAVISAIDSLPLFPKVMEVVGVGYTVWFSYRYLVFKKNRKELLEKIEDLKEQILGQSDAD